MVTARTLTGLAVLAGTAWATGGAIRRWWHEWGVDPLEAALDLPGDELVPQPLAIETRGIDIAAPPADVWPWLVQMGYGRAGWYSYDVIDMRGRSAHDLLPDLAELSVGDVMPTHPCGGFVVKAIEPYRSLVLYLDTALVAEQAAAAERDPAPESTPANLRTSGAFMASAGSEFAASWAFVLEPTATGTRLVERMRARLTGGGTVAPITAPALGFGVFLMMRRQMLGIRERAEAQAGAHGDVHAAAHDEDYVVAPEPLVAAPG